MRWSLVNNDEKKLVKSKLNESGYSEVIGTVIMIISSSFFIAGILISLLS